MQFGLKDIFINQINSVFTAFPEIEKVVLYGSRAKGNYRAGSDIDLVIFGDKITYKDFTEISLSLDNLLIPFKIDIALYKRITDDDIRNHITRVGRVFYIRSSTTN
jgi:predicted nucleotidyltransferase